MDWSRCSRLAGWVADAAAQVQEEEPAVVAAVAAVAVAACQYVEVGVEDSQGSREDLLGPSLAELLFLLQIRSK